MIPIENILFASETVGAVRGSIPRPATPTTTPPLYRRRPSADPADKAAIFEGNARLVYGRLSTQPGTAIIMVTGGMMRVAVLDDWQGLARQAADWSALERRAELVFFTAPFADENAAAASLADFDVLMVMRERTAFPNSLIARLPRLKLFAMTGRRGSALDLVALAKRGVTICYADHDMTAATAELTLGLIIAAARAIPAGDAAIRAGGFQGGVPAGFQLAGKTLGIIGLGKLGARLARYATALDMKLLAWSQNLTEAAATAAGAHYVTKERLLAESDVISLHSCFPRARAD